MKEANRWFAQAATEYPFGYKATTNWADLEDGTLARYQVVLFLDTRLGAPEQMAFQRYMGFHFAAFAMRPSGCSEYVSNTWRPTAAVLPVDDANHPAIKDCRSPLIKRRRIGLS